MDNLLNKLCEKSEAELWEMVKVEQWTPEHAEVAFYLTEIMKGVKKIEHLKLVQEAMKKAEEMGDAGMEHMMGTEPQMSHYAAYAYARRGGRGGRRGGRGRYNYTYNSDEDEDYDYNEYARGGNRGNSNSNSGNYAQGDNGNYGHHPMHYPYPGYMPEGMEGGHIPPAMYGLMPYFESKITEKVEKEWEKERSKDKEKESSGGPGRMPPPSTK